MVEDRVFSLQAALLQVRQVLCSGFPGRYFIEALRKAEVQSNKRVHQELGGLAEDRGRSYTQPLNQIPRFDDQPVHLLKIVARGGQSGRIHQLLRSVHEVLLCLKERMDLRFPIAPRRLS